MKSKSDVILALGKIIIRNEAMLGNESGRSMSAYDDFSNFTRELNNADAKKAYEALKKDFYNLLEGKEELTIDLGDIFFIMAEHPVWCSDQEIANILDDSIYSEYPIVKKYIKDSSLPDHIGGYKRKVPDVKHTIIWDEEVKMGGRDYSDGSVRASQWHMTKGLVFHILLDNGIDCRYQLGPTRKIADLLQSGLEETDFSRADDYYKGLLKTVPIHEIYESVDTLVDIGIKVENKSLAPAVAKNFVKEFEKYQFDNVGSLYDWQCEAKNTINVKSEEESFLYGLYLIISNIKWEVGIFGGEEIRGKTYPRAAANILKLIEKAQKNPGGEREYFKREIEKIADEITKKRPKSRFFGFFNKRQTSTQERYDKILRAIVDFDIRPHRDPYLLDSKRGVEPP